MLDASLIFDGSTPNTGVAITASRASTNVLDFLASRDIGAGAVLRFHVIATAAFAGATSLQIAAQSSPDNATFVDMILSPAYPVANLTANTRLFRYVVPDFQLMDSGTPNRYWRLNYTVVGGPFTAGAVFAYMTTSEDVEEFYAVPKNYSQTA